MKRSIGLNVKPPQGKCADRYCAWHGSIAVRGKVFEGIVRSARAHNTAAIEFGYHFHLQKYERFERRTSRIPAHNPPCIHAKEGDRVVIAECRPISKTKHFIVVGFAK